MITVIGLDGSPLSPTASAAVATATLVAGGRRQLAAVPAASGTPTVVLGELAPALDALAAHDGDAVVLASGDPGFFGIVRALRQHGLAPVVLPAVSSVSLAFARAGLPWDDALVVSAHGRDLRPAVNVCRAHPKVAVLTGPGAGPADIGAALTGWDRRLIVCEQLGGDGERVTACSPASAGTRSWPDPNVVLVLADGPGRTDGPDLAAGPDREGPGWEGLGWSWPRSPVPPGWALPEEEFDCQGAVITKAEVRGLALARLGPGPGRLIWDVGAGAGSVAVECARFGAAVIAVERDERRCALVRANARRHRVDVRVVAGQAPAALAGLPAPDAAFIGGGGPAAVAAVAARQPARVVAALAAAERVGPAHAALAAAGYQVQGTLVQAARLAPLPGGVHRLSAVNPVFLLWAHPAAPGQNRGPA
ncbi:MAG TPA: precorrin-6y C5,15-methyltransferase (decarboxylating) subunit CbiE [Streptosporangiaceae bacterium]|nr:precorrin-6y C5,15-methyltransferase (decarboxylating) subunit CbiE [Streptosporangiaceae bacterium]